MSVGNMPYIKSEDREQYDVFQDALLAIRVPNPGALNYLITLLIQNYLHQNGWNYQHMNDVLGAMEGAKLELYRRQVAPYEDKKIVENGDV